MVLAQVGCACFRICTLHSWCSATQVLAWSKIKLFRHKSYLQKYRLYTHSTFQPNTNSRNTMPLKRAVHQRCLWAVHTVWVCVGFLVVCLWMVGPHNMLSKPANSRNVVLVLQKPAYSPTAKASLMESSTSVGFWPCIKFLGNNNNTYYYCLIGFGRLGLVWYTVGAILDQKTV